MCTPRIKCLVRPFGHVSWDFPWLLYVYSAYIVHKTLSSVQIHSGIENVAAKSSHLVNTLRHLATHRALFQPAQDNRARGNYSIDQRNKDITSLSLHLSNGLSEFAIVSDNPFIALGIFMG